MKKLKLSLQSIDGAQILSREQLRTIKGGETTGTGCSTAACTLSVKDANGVYIQYNGYCASTTLTTGSAYGSISGTTACWCRTDASKDPVELTSNGGTSRCVI